MKKVLFNIILLTLMQSALGQTATFYDFNIAGQLSSLFNGSGSVSSVTEVSTGGIGNFQVLITVYCPHKNVLLSMG